MIANNSYNPNVILSWEDLLVSIQSGLQHPEATQWHIFNYLQANYKTLESRLVRMLLMAYLKVRNERPSLVNSCMLRLALDISATFSDFNLPVFLEYWGYPNLLRPEDALQHKNNDSSCLPSLCKCVENAKLSYCKKHGIISTVLNDRCLLAVKVFDFVNDGHSCHSVKLVDGQGHLAYADSKIFPCKLADIPYKLFDAVTESSSEWSKYETVKSLSFSKKSVTDVFPVIVGYVDRFVFKHGHYHIYDRLSRHFVAERPGVKISPGDYVSFCPVVAKYDKFKSAVVLNMLERQRGRNEFGLLIAKITQVDFSHNTLFYEIQGVLPKSDGGELERYGVMSQDRLMNLKSFSGNLIGRSVRIVLFLKRNTDFEKHNYVVEAWL